MRSVPATVACVALLLAGACSPLKNFNYYREGPGTDLNTPELPEETLSLDQYIAEICQQAGISDCPPKLGSEYWALIVQAGMNDIDRRCDAFLAYVDYLKRSQDHWIKQLGDTLKASSAIVGATTQSDKPLKILSAAFGLATDTYTNMTGRLLTLADQTTIQSVVLGQQKRYREDIIKLGNRIRHKSAAVHALRSYLRICMPFTIEAKINSTVTIYEQAGTAALGTKERDPLISARTIDGRLTVRQPVSRPARSPVSKPPAPPKPPKKKESSRTQPSPTDRQPPNGKSAVEKHCVKSTDVFCTKLVKFIFPDGRNLNKENETKLFEVLKTIDQNAKRIDLWKVMRRAENIEQRKKLHEAARAANLNGLE